MNYESLKIFSKRKTISTAIIVLMITMTIPMLALQPVTAHSPPYNIPTYAFINVAPNPAAIGQSVTVGLWLVQPSPTSSGPYGDRWSNLTVVVGHPDGTKETLGPFTADDTGGTYTIYTPTAEGNYTFQMIFGGQTLTGSNPPPTGYSAAAKAFIGDYYQPSQSNIAALTVQQNPIPAIPTNPLPTNYWEKPVNAENVQTWYSIAGNWLGLGTIFSGNTGSYSVSSNYNPYTTAPKSAHVLWTKPISSGGAIGGEFGGTTTSNYYSTSQYEPKFAPVILNGILYYTVFPGASTNPTGTVAVDLHTGKTLWTNTSPLTSASMVSGGVGGPSGGTPTNLRCGQILNYVTPNQYGALTYLWTTGTPAGMNASPGSTTYNMFDAMTGNYILSVVNGTALQSLIQDDNGNLIGYYVNSTNPNAPTFNAWNSTKCIVAGTNGEAAWMWRPTQNAQINFAKGIMWSQPIPTNISDMPLPRPLGLTSTGMVTAFTFVTDGVALLTSSATTGGNLFQAGYRIDAGFDGKTGSLLWIANHTETPYSRVPVITAGSGNYIEVNYATGVVTAYSLRTGVKQWSTDLPNPNPYNSIGGYQADSANGTMYIWGLGGDIYSVDIATGKINWQTSTTILHGDPGTNTPYGIWPIWTFPVGTIADGILFLGEGHEYSPPLFHGAKELAINTTDGSLVWSMLAFDVSNPIAISDGVGVVLNSYDNQIYAYGMGASKTTITAPSVGVTTTTPITISGTITDISAGSQQQAVAANYPNGLPCVSEASQSQFMEAVYEQQPQPTNTTGVSVTISVVDSNGNYRTIGTTTSNADGTFDFTWTPDIAGHFTVMAVFEGTQSYYPSHASASFYASEPQATTTPTTTAPSTADLYFIPAIIGVIIAIIAVGAVLALLVNKKL